MRAERAELAQAGVVFDRVSVTLENGNLRVRGRAAVLRATAVTVLSPPAGSEEPATEEAIPRVFEFRRSGRGWQLSGSRTATGEGMASITEPQASSVDARFVGDPGPAAPRSQVVGSGPVSDAKPVESGTVRLQGIPPGMCYACMHDYAYAHWKNYHPGYRNFNGKGGDCTNFASQVLRRGGWKDDLGWYRSNDNWWYNSQNQTFTWAGAQNWSRFAPKRTMRLDNVWKVGLADILQMDYTRDGVIDHTMIVTAVTSYDVYLTYHTTDTKNRSMKSIISAYPGAWYCAYRT